MADNKKLIDNTDSQENNPMVNNFVPTSEQHSSDIHRSQSIFRSTWLKIHDEFEQMKKEDNEPGADDGLRTDAINLLGTKPKDKSKKGKVVKFEDKVAGANIKDWSEQKKHTTSFMEWLKTFFNPNGKEIRYTYGDLLNRPDYIPRDLDLSRFEEDDLGLAKMDENLRKNIELYGNQMVAQYLHNVKLNF